MTQPKFVCPECGGGFPSPIRIDSGHKGTKDGCPWCGHLARYDLGGEE